MSRLEDYNVKAFFELVRAGLWEGQRPVQSSKFKVEGGINWGEVYRLAEEQSVIGLVTAGIETLQVPISQAVRLQFIGQTLQIEQRNKAMNEFEANLIRKLRENGIYALVVKGQGIAQCYERPLWRTCGDVDLFLDAGNYEKAKTYLLPLATDVEDENMFKKHLGMTIDGWLVELHGTMHNNLSKRVNKGVDEVQKDIFFNGSVRRWHYNDTTILLPSADNDVIIIFTHFLNHFFVGGVGLRQICDWCRLLWTYRDNLDLAMLKKRLKAMGLMTEWKAFAAFAVEWLGMPASAMPLYINSVSYSRKAHRICNIVMQSGNFGHNKDNSYHVRYTGVRYQLYALMRRAGEFIHLATIFPVDAPQFFMSYISRKC